MNKLNSNRHIAITSIAVIALVLTFNSPIHAQYSIENGLISAGGGITTGQGSIVSGTLGQPWCGSGMGTLQLCFSGFWYVTQNRANQVFVESNGVPKSFTLIGNYPNPFNPATTISFTIPEQSYVRLMVYSAAGQYVDTLLDGELGKGYHRVLWSPVKESAGVYLYTLQAGTNLLTGKMLFLK